MAAPGATAVSGVDRRWRARDVVLLAPKILLTALLILAISDMVVGVFLRYVVVAITDRLDLDPINFFWVEEVGEYSLAWLTMIGAGIGIGERAHFTLHVVTHHLPLVAQRAIHVATHLLIAGFGALVAFSVPIVFALGTAAVMGLVLGGNSLEMLASSLIGASQNWVLLAIPSFIFAGTVMERCGMSNALVDLARALVGWLRGGLGMSVIVVSYFFSDICGSKMAEVSALGSTLMPPLKRAGYRAEDGASLIASGTAMGMLVPPAIFLIVIGEVTNTSVVALFLAGFVPAAVIGLCLCLLVLIQAHLLGWPKDTRPSLMFLLRSLRDAAVPLVIPLVILGGFYLGAFTATEAGAIVALYSLLAARLYYRNLSWMQILRIGYDSAVLTAAVVFLLAVATIFQYLMGVTGVPVLLGELLRPLESAQWLFLLGVVLLTMVFGMVLEGLPAAVVLIPVVFPIAMRLGINPIHFDIVQTAAVGIGLFLPPMGVGLLMALRFADVPVGEHARTYWPYVLALLVGLMLIICLPELSLEIPRGAGFVR